VLKKRTRGVPLVKSIVMILDRERCLEKNADRYISIVVILDCKVKVAHSYKLFRNRGIEFREDHG
jgi:hypothetical protein